MNINESIEKAEEEFPQGGNYFNIKEGDNKVRILSEMVAVPQWWDGSKYQMVVENDKHPEDRQISVKWLCWVIDRKDDKVKLAKLPHTIAKTVGNLQENPEWAFEGSPMPYDVTISAKGAGSKEVEYSVMPSPKRDPVSKEVLDDLEKQTPVEDIRHSMKEKRQKELGLIDSISSEERYTKEQQKEADRIDAENIPF